eukprot:4799883-Prymnesium_polylepis.1
MWLRSLQLCVDVCAGVARTRALCVAARLLQFPHRRWLPQLTPRTTSDHSRGNPMISVPSARTMAAPASRVRPSSDFSPRVSSTRPVTRTR